MCASPNASGLRAASEVLDLIARIAPFFAVIAVGALAARAGLLNAKVGGWLSAYTFWIGFPALLIHWLGAAPPPDVGQGLTLGAYAAVMGGLIVAVWWTGRRLGWVSAEAAAGLPMVSGVGNTAFLGAPLAVAVLGPGARPLAATLVAVDFILLMSLTIAILQTGAASLGLWRALRRVLANPTVLGAATGLALSITGTRPPAVLDQGLAILAATASSVALLALGGLIGREGALPPRDDLPVLTLALITKLLLAPLLVWAALGAAGASPEMRACATLLAACPTAVNVFIQTRTMGVFAHGAAQAIVAGTVLSGLTLTAAAHFLR